MTITTPEKATQQQHEWLHPGLEGGIIPYEFGHIGLYTSLYSCK